VDTGLNDIALNIRDPVHGTLQFGEVEMRIIDSPQMQRLRSIRQLAMAHYVYPGAHHTRFEHSLGTCHLADRMAMRLGLKKDVRRRLRLAALLHDVGHIAFSHEAEEVTHTRLGTHEEIGRKMILSGSLAKIIGEVDEPRKVADYAMGHSYGALIAGDIGADRMDYLLRDAHYTGVAYGVIDVERILSTIEWVRAWGLAVRRGGLEAVESLLLARFEMFSTVYMHHTVRIASGMLQMALREAMRAKSFDWAGAMNEGDSLMLSRLHSIPTARPFVERIRARNLYKRALALNWKKLKKEQRAEISSGRLARHLKQKTGASVYVDIPQDFGKAADIPIITQDGLVPVGKLSPLVAALDSTIESRSFALVCCEESERRRVEKEARSYLRV